MYKLLIVDDESIVRRGIIKCIDFGLLGIDRVFEAENGEKALHILETNNIDIVLADINMPKINGIDFARRAKVLNKSIKIAFITGYDYFDYAISALRIGVDDYVLKPISKVDIIELINKLIDKKRSEESAQIIKEAVNEITKKLNINEDRSNKELITNIIEDNIGNVEFSLNMLATELGFSTGYLSTLFKKLFWVNFREYIFNIRLERAKLLLLSTSMRNYEIAEAIGIEDPNYLSACFKKKYNLTITEFRNSIGQIK